jgi:hypothetical protein
VKSEHTIGYIKGRFQSLRGLWQQIKNPRDHLLAIAWIKACLILHNLIIDIEGEIDESDPFYIQMLAEGTVVDVEDAGEAIGLDGADETHETAGKRKRAYLQHQLLTSLEGAV